jgi:hypothetical protein
MQRLAEFSTKPVWHPEHPEKVHDWHDDPKLKQSMQVKFALSKVNPVAHDEQLVELHEAHEKW